MERFFGGNPALVLARLAILSLIVGVVLAALGFSPYDLVQTLRDLIQRIYDMGFADDREGLPLLPARRRDRVPDLARDAGIQSARPQRRRSVGRFGTDRAERAVSNCGDRR